MANLMFFSLCLSFNIISFLPFPTNAISSCNGTCQTLNDCSGQLICINGKCDDDPDVGTHICGGTSPPPADPISSCNGPCRTLNDCSGQLICINGKCYDDPDLGTHICPGTSPSPSSSPTDACRQYQTLVCQGESHPTYTCSPPITSSTHAKLTNNDFSEGGNGRGISMCDKKYHHNSEPIVALSTGWYNGGSRCGQMIRITASNRRSVLAKVVDECDSMKGCDKQHAYRPPCGNNIVDGSDAVWNALGLDKDLGIVNVTWSMARLEYMLVCSSV